MQQNSKALKAPTPKTLNVKITRTACYTNVSDCAGLAYFQNNTNKSYGCTVWFAANGGRSNWTYGPNGTHEIQVRYGDTFSCVLAQDAPPSPSEQRYYIYVK